jgi:hypothetical protein
MSQGEGEINKGKIDQLISDNKEAYDEAIESGAISAPSYEHSMGYNEGGDFTKVTGNSNIDHSKLPASAMGEAPKGMNWYRSDDEVYAVHPDGTRYEGYKNTNYAKVEDPNYGTYYLQQTEPHHVDVATDIIGPMVAMAITAPMLAGVAGLVAPSLGINTTLGTTLLSSAFRAAPSLAMSGGQNWEAFAASLAGGAVGSVTGSPLLGSAAKIGVNYGLNEIQKP